MKLTDNLKHLNADCMQLVVTVTRSPAVHFMHALIHCWPVALQSNWRQIQWLQKGFGHLILYSVAAISYNNYSDMIAPISAEVLQGQPEL